MARGRTRTFPARLGSMCRIWNGLPGSRTPGWFELAQDLREKGLQKRLTITSHAGLAD